MRLLLDIVTFITVHSPERISKKTMVALRNEIAVREMSTISLGEMTA
jgi:hypothetical protein